MLKNIAISILILIIAYFIGKIGNFFLNGGTKKIKKFNFWVFMYLVIFQDYLLYHQSKLISKEILKRKDFFLKKGILNFMSSENREELFDLTYSFSSIYRLLLENKEDYIYDYYNSCIKHLEKINNKKIEQNENEDKIESIIDKLNARAKITYT